MYHLLRLRNISDMSFQDVELVPRQLAGLVEVEALPLGFLRE